MFCLGSRVEVVYIFLSFLVVLCSTVFLFCLYLFCCVGILGVVFCQGSRGRGFLDIPQPFGGSLSSLGRFLCVVGAVFYGCCRFVTSEPCRWRPPAPGLRFGYLVAVARKS